MQEIRRQSPLSLQIAIYVTPLAKHDVFVLFGNRNSIGKLV